MTTFAKHRWWILTVALTAPIVAIAADVPNMFTSGTVVSSSQVNANFKNLSDRLTSLESAPRPVTTYVRWGRTVCPAGATVLYAGYAAGGHYNQGGSGADTLCLHATPEWLTYDDANQGGAQIYGTEFETDTYGIASFRALHNREAQCVVCEVPRASQLMVPGRTSCPTSWNLEYNGYLMAQHATHTKSDWTCVDAAPESAGNSADQNGHLFYPTEVECGSLLCQAGGYVQDREVTCAVCTK